MNGAKQVCPNCGSTNVHIDRTNIISWLGLDSSYRCDKCGYTGIFPHVDADDVEDHQQEVWERGRLETEHGKDRPTRGRIILGALFLLAGVLPAFYAPWGAGKLAGLLSLAIGGAIMIEYFSSMNPLD